MTITKNLLTILSLTLTLSLVGCGSTKKKNNQNNAETAEMVDGMNSAVSFEVNGSSDSANAGGLSTVYFDFDSSTLSSSTKMSLDSNVEILKNNASVKIQVEGHCDERGGIEYNLALGEKRAKAVRNYMVSMGIASSRITTISFGKEKPISFGHDESSWGQNRRATFVITQK